MRFLSRKPPKAKASPEASAARHRAEEALERARSQTPMYRDLAEQLREVRERNHLAEAFEHTFKRGHA